VPGWLPLSLQLAAGNAAMLVALAWLERPLAWWLDAGLADRAGWLGVTIGAAVATYFLALWLTGLRPSTLRLD